MGLAENLQDIQERIRNSAARAGRDPGTITLIAVSKTHPPDAVAEAARLGLTVFGESKVQEAKAKIPLCPGRIRWHMLGHLQSNKCRDAITLFEMVQSVDILELAEELNKKADQASRTLPILLEVNIVGADYAMSKRTTAYVRYENGDNDKAAGNAGAFTRWNLGARHSF